MAKQVIISGKKPKRLKTTTPIYHSLNFTIAYTGGIVAAFSHDLSPTVILMFATTIFVMILEIKRYKKMRVIKTAEFDKQNQLLFKQIETNYEITTFVCSCGTTKFIISSKYQAIDYICQECENNKFLSANDANLSIQNFINQYSTTKESKKDYLTPTEYITTLDIDFDFKTQIIYQDGNTIAQYFIKVPCEIDFINEKVFNFTVLGFAGKEVETYKWD